jgi:hypothetical protein
LEALRAVGLRGWSLYSFRQYWAETGNENELAVAIPGVVQWSDERLSNYQPVGAES